MNNPEIFVFIVTELAFWVSIPFAIRFARRDPNPFDHL